MYFPAQQFVPTYLPLFLLGIYACWIKTNSLTSRTERVLYPTALFAVCGFNLGWVAASAGAIALSIILFIQTAPIPFLILGDISYSLYLVHTTTGGRVMNLASRFAHSYPAKISWLVVALCISLGAAFLLYSLVERPAKAWAARIGYFQAEASAKGAASSR